MMNPGSGVVEAGVQLALGTVVLGRDDIVAFASEFDAQPFHLDESAAASTLLGGLAASGWHTCATVMGLLRRTLGEHALTVEPAGAEEVVWLKPVRPGDALTGRLAWGARSCGACDRQLGAYPATVEIVNQHADPVMRWRIDCLLQGVAELQPFKFQDCPMRQARPARVARSGGDHGIKFFESVAPGDEIQLGDYEFTPKRIQDFRTSYDGMANASQTDYVPLTASAWQLTAAWMHCMVRYYGHHARLLQAQGEPVPMLGPAAGVKHLRWHRPIRAGETITFRAWAERKIQIASHQDWGLLVVGAEGANKSGEVVVSFYPQMLLERASRRQFASTPVCRGGE